MEQETESKNSTEERSRLLDNGSKPEPQYGFNTKTKAQETAILCLLLVLSAISLCIDLIPLPFFTHEAKKRGLTETQAGIIISCYDLARFVSAPLCPTIVSIPKIFTILIFLLNIGGLLLMLQGPLMYTLQE